MEKRKQDELVDQQLEEIRGGLAADRGKLGGRVMGSFENDLHKPDDDAGGSEPVQGGTTPLDDPRHR